LGKKRSLFKPKLITEDIILKVKVSSVMERRDALVQGLPSVAKRGIPS
jgi:hypothetical protein